MQVLPAECGQGDRRVQLDGTISPQDYQDMKGKVDKDLVLFKSKLNGLQDQPSPYKTYISKTVPMLENLTGFYKEADSQTKRKILGCIFSEKLVFEKGKDATTPFTEPIQVLFKIARVLQGSKNKKEVENDLLSTLAPQAEGESIHYYTFFLSANIAINADNQAYNL